MQNYHDMIRATLNSPIEQFNERTGKLCRVLLGYQLQYDVSEFFPLLTTRKLFFNGIKGELLSFFRGYDNAVDFRNMGCNLWNQNANETKAWLDNPHRKGEDDIGRCYGVQWTAWKDRRVINSSDGKEFDRLSELGYSVVMYDSSRGLFLFEREINQLENVLRTLLTNPSDRRMIITAWNPAEIDLQALPACHMDYRYIALENPKVLHLVMTIRSMDGFLGAPTNIATTALQLLIMARLSGFAPGTITMQAANCHLYEDHFEQAEELLKREHLSLPKVLLSDNVKPIINLDDIKGAFTRIKPDDIVLQDYQHLARIDAPMSA
jgi:thymidylate synthase